MNFLRSAPELRKLFEEAYGHVLDLLQVSWDPPHAQYRGINPTVNSMINESYMHYIEHNEVAQVIIHSSFEECMTSFLKYARSTHLLPPNVAVIWSWSEKCFLRKYSSEVVTSDKDLTKKFAIYLTGWNRVSSIQ
jgi:hypothetical protein